MCASVQTIANAQITNMPGNKPGDKATFVCKANYVWSDEKEDEKLSTCQDNGQWSPIPHFCLGVL